MLQQQMSKSVRIFSNIKSRVNLSLKVFPLKSKNKMQFNEHLTESNLTSTDSFSEQIQIIYAIGSCILRNKFEKRSIFTYPLKLVMKVHFFCFFGSQYACLKLIFARFQTQQRLYITYLDRNNLFLKYQHQIKYLLGIILRTSMLLGVFFIE